MNKTKIEWCDYTWNPVTGCLHGCPYCYARKISERFKWNGGFHPVFHPDRLNDPAKVKKPQTIFVSSMGDLFGDWVPDEWIYDVVKACNLAPWHTYIFLTKNPARYNRLPAAIFLGNKWFGTSVTKQEDYHRIMSIRSLPDWIKTFVSFEPLLEELDLDLYNVNQVIIGAQTNPTIEVTEAMVRPIGAAAGQSIPVFCKDSMPKWAKCRRELLWSVNKSLAVV